MQALGVTLGVIGLVFVAIFHMPVKEKAPVKATLPPTSECDEGQVSSCGTHLSENQAGSIAITSEKVHCPSTEKSDAATSPQTSEELVCNCMDWKKWLKEYQFYQVSREDPQICKCM